MYSAALLRPGSAIGAYPQREDRRESWLERTVDNIAGLFRQYVYSGRVNYRQFLVLVDLHSERLTDINNESLRQCAMDVRQRLYREGLHDELVAEAFALIREVSTRCLGLRHHDVQLYGGWVMLRGMIAEMETGEGKTLTATLPACTAALAGIPVHLVTVNDFLVGRDARWMASIYEFFGLTVGVVKEASTLEQRKQAYGCDITYCTNKQLTFDYLKDRLLLDQESRPLHLRLEGVYNQKPKTSRLLMRGLCFAIVDEADSVLIDEARTPLVISNTKKLEQEVALYKQAISLAGKLSRLRHYQLDQRQRQIKLTDVGCSKLNSLTRLMDSVWSGKRRRESLILQALSALHLYHRDQHYLVKEGKVQIIDEYTGRVMPDRSWERGLHQMIETKEGLEISGRQETLARISYQRFFRRYLHLAGMTGTAQEVTKELGTVYHLKVETIPTHKPVQRQHLRDRVFARKAQKWDFIIQTIQALHQQGRPVLIGAKSVGTSEYLSQRLMAANLPHQVLNARQDEHEAQIISDAGQRGSITVATNMAGRGTDIQLEPGVAELGGLHVLATERHEARRIDRQLFGRGARQGDPGSYQTIVSLEDDFIAELFGQRLQTLFSKRSSPLPHWLGRLITYFSQVNAERHHRQIRQSLLEHDDNLNDILAFSGRGE